jgi:hypothetical protein
MDPDLGREIGIRGEGLRTQPILSYKACCYAARGAQNKKVHQPTVGYPAWQGWASSGVKAEVMVISPLGRVRRAPHGV